MTLKSSTMSSMGEVDRSEASRRRGLCACSRCKRSARRCAKRSRSSKRWTRRRKLRQHVSGVWRERVVVRLGSKPRLWQRTPAISQARR